MDLVSREQELLEALSEFDNKMRALNDEILTKQQELREMQFDRANLVGRVQEVRNLHALMTEPVASQVIEQPQPAQQQTPPTAVDNPQQP